MKQEIRSMLETPFSADQIKQRKGLWGKTLDYIEGHAVIQRLNLAFESDWSFQITHFEVFDEEVVVMGKLAAGDIIKMQFGSNRITKDSETGKVLSLGDDLKAAGTDALKKCASLLGVGLHLYSESTASEEPRKKEGKLRTSREPAGSIVPFPKPVVSKPASVGKPESHVAKTSSPKTADSKPKEDTQSSDERAESSVATGTDGSFDRITQKQMNYVLALGKRSKLTARAIDGMSREMFSVSLSYLSKHQASALINRLCE